MTAELNIEAAGHRDAGTDAVHSESSERPRNASSSWRRMLPGRGSWRLANCEPCRSRAVSVAAVDALPGDVANQGEPRALGAEQFVEVAADVDPLLGRRRAGTATAISQPGTSGSSSGSRLRWSVSAMPDSVVCRRAFSTATAARRASCSASSRSSCGQAGAGTRP